MIGQTFGKWFGELEQHIMAYFQTLLPFLKCEDDVISMVSGRQLYQIHDRQKRQLLYPKPTLIQITFAVATPMVLKPYNIYINHGFQLNFQCPWLSKQIPTTFLLVPPVITARSKQKREAYEMISNNIEDETHHKYGTNHEHDDPFKDLTTTQLYHLMGIFLKNYGYNGTECIKHSVCQLASIPLHRDDDILHEVLHYVLTPSEHREKHLNENSNTSVDDWLFDEYLDAEIGGKNGEDCDVLYQYCHKSPLDEITHVAFDDGDLSNVDF